MARVFGDSVSVHCAAGPTDAVRRPALCVELRPGEALVGPLALAGHAGCGYCARARMAAADAAARLMDGDPHEPAGQGGAEDLALAMLEEEVRALHDDPLDRHPLVGHVRIGDAATGRTSLHRVIPLARCPVCGGAEGAREPACQQAGLRLEPPEALLADLAGWVDPRTGIIARMEFEPTEAPIVVTASPPFVLEEDGSLRRLPLGWGKGLTISSAILSAAGETIERYSASVPAPARLVTRRTADLDGEVLDPRQCALYSDDQYSRAGFPYARFNPDLPHPWIRGRWLGSETPVWVPAVFAFLSLTLRREQQICQGTSNGLAAAADFEEAALRATFELIERDAFMSAWLNASAGRRLVIDASLQPELRQVLRGVEELGAAVELYLLETSVCGTAILALALGDGAQYPGATIGIGADLDPLAALRQAVLELGQTGPHLRRLMRSGGVAVPAEASSVREMIDHAAYYFPRGRAAAFDRVRGQAPPLALGDLAQRTAARSLASCAAILNASGIRVALIDVTSADVATGPFRVVRAVSPDLQPISYGYGFDRLPVPRVQERSVAPDAPIHPIW